MAVEPWELTELSCTARVILCCLIAYKSRNDRWPSASEVATQSGVTKKTVIAAVRQLVACGYVLKSDSGHLIGWGKTLGDRGVETTPNRGKNYTASRGKNYTDQTPKTAPSPLPIRSRTHNAGTRARAYARPSWWSQTIADPLGGVPVSLEEFVANTWIKASRERGIHQTPMSMRQERGRLMQLLELAQSLAPAVAESRGWEPLQAFELLVQRAVRDYGRDFDEDEDSRKPRGLRWRVGFLTARWQEYTRGAVKAS